MSGSTTPATTPRTPVDGFYRPAAAIASDTLWGIGVRNGVKADLTFTMDVLAAFLAEQVGTGKDGFTPLFALETDGDRRVWRITGWSGPSGRTAPATGYIGPSGIVATKAEATDVRGAQGLQGSSTGVPGWSPVFSTEADGAKIYLKISDWVGGTDISTKPQTGLYVTASGFSADKTLATDLRGATGAAGTPSLTGPGVLGAASAGAAGTIPLGRRVGLRGASGAPALVSASPMPIASTRVIYLGDTAGVGLASNSVQTTASGTQMMCWLHYLLRRRFIFDLSADRYGGNTFKISNLITPSTGAPQAQLTAALAAGADVVILDSCSVDISVGEAPATTFANMQTLINYFLAAGTQVIIIGPRPWNPWNSDSALAAQYKRRAQYLGTLLARYARATSGVAYADAWRALVDPATGDAKTGYVAVDGLTASYPGVVACAMVAKRVARILDSMLSPIGEARLSWGAADAWSTDDPTGNLLGAAGVFGSSGGSAGTGVSGDVGSGWSLASNVAAGNISGTAVASRVTSPEGCRQTVTLAGRSITSGTSETFVLNLTTPIDFSAGMYAAGDVISASAEIKMSGLTNCLGCVINLVENAGDGSSAFTVTDSRVATSTTAVLAGDESGILMTPAYTLRTPASTGTRNLSVNVRFAFANAGAAADGSFSVERVTIRKQ